MAAVTDDRPLSAKRSMIDIHCHILPEVDDGAKSWEMALEMCRLARQDGIDHIVATPHANEHYAFDRDRLMIKLEELERRTAGLLTLSLGCDFHLSYDNLEDVLAHPGRYTIGNSHYLLVEFSDYAISSQINEVFGRLFRIGLIPVVTHPERNPILQQDLRRVQEWAEQGCVIQVTASAVTGSWGDSPRRCSQWLLEHGAVHVLASDAHDDKYRVPLLSAAQAAVSKVFGPEVARALVEDNPRAIINGRPVPFLPEG
jgi:protein-tyrosine phosphatase